MRKVSETALWRSDRAEALPSFRLTNGRAIYLGSCISEGLMFMRDVVFYISPSISAREGFEVFKIQSLPSAKSVDSIN